MPAWWRATTRVEAGDSAGDLHHLACEMPAGLGLTTLR